MPVYASRITKNLQTIYGASGSAVPFYAESDFKTWMAANPNNVYSSGSNYIVYNALVTDVLRGVPPYTILDRTNPDIPLGKTLNDMGKDIRIGSITEIDYVVFRRVQVPGLIANEGGGGTTGYVVVDNNCSDLTRPRFAVRVARI